MSGEDRRERESGHPAIMQERRDTTNPNILQDRANREIFAERREVASGGRDIFQERRETTREMFQERSNPSIIQERREAATRDIFQDRRDPSAREIHVDRREGREIISDRREGREMLADRREGREMMTDRRDGSREIMPERRDGSREMIGERRDGSREMHGERRDNSRDRKPIKVWSANRNVKKALVVGSYDEFLKKGRERLCLAGSEPFRVVLESDGTQVEDAEYFHMLPENTVFIVLRSGEAWAPPGVDIVTQVVSTIPKIVCETLAALGLQDEIPSWKIMDNKGKVTVVLHWEKEHPPGQPPDLQILSKVGLPSGFGLSRGPSRQSSITSGIATASGPRLLGVGGKTRITPSPCLSRDNSRNSDRHQNSLDGGYGPLHNLLANRDARLILPTSSTDRDARLLQASADPHKKPGAQAPQVTVITADNDAKVAGGKGGGHDTHKSGAPPPPGASIMPPRQFIGGAAVPSPRLLSRQGSSMESVPAVHTHTAECAGGLISRLSQPLASNQQPLSNHTRGSPTSTECDFHCCSLHAGAGAGAGAGQPGHKHAATSPIQAEDGRRTLPKGAHVRFDVETRGSHTKCDAIIQLDNSGGESSESDGEGIEDGVNAVKHLLLVDQLSADQKLHLSIKDIGIILERLSSKILDVEKLEREKEDDEVYNWTIKATIRGEVMRELGVIYNSNYYTISEHPDYIPDPPSPPEDGEETKQ